MAREGDNELSLCLNKAISIYIYKITSHKYIWQYNVLNFLAKGGKLSNMMCARVSKCQSKWLIDNFSLKIKKKKTSSCTIKSNQKTQKHP